MFSEILFAEAVVFCLTWGASPCQSVGSVSVMHSVSARVYGTCPPCQPRIFHRRSHLLCESPERWERPPPTLEGAQVHGEVSRCPWDTPGCQLASAKPGLLSGRGLSFEPFEDGAEEHWGSNSSCLGKTVFLSCLRSAV